MQSGVTGFKSYRETTYTASYRKVTSHTKAKAVYRYTAATTDLKYASESMPIGIGYTGFNNTGFPDSTDSVDPNGNDTTIGGLYNRTVITMAQRRAEVECKQKMLDTKLDLAETLVDIDKSVLMIARRSMQVLYAWRSVRNGNYELAAKWLGLHPKRWTFDTPFEAWLEFQYAWLPLLSDIFGAVDLTTSLFKEKRAVGRVRRRVSEALTVPQPPANSSWSNLKVETVGVCEVEVQLRFKISDENLAFISGLNLTNPLYIFWVSMPFSFVVDWILPIGDWLNSLTAPLGLTFLKGYRTTKCYGKMSVTGERTAPQFWSKVSQLSEASSTAESLYMDRFAYTSFPMSYTYFRFPFSSPQRIASAVALTHMTAKLR
jgi:hypothetical protein